MRVHARSSGFYVIQEVMSGQDSGLRKVSNYFNPFLEGGSFTRSLNEAVVNVRLIIFWVWLLGHASAMAAMHGKWAGPGKAKVAWWHSASCKSNKLESKNEVGKNIQSLFLFFLWPSVQSAVHTHYSK